MQEAGVRRAQLGAQHGVLFVPRAGDGVEAQAAALQFAGGHVQTAREDLILEDLQGLASIQGGPHLERVPGFQAYRGRLRGGEVCVEVGLDDGDAIGAHEDGGRKPSSLPLPRERIAQKMGA